ncbi:MAG: hypothetical protein KAY24_02065 [Candidatus Eisenbacteria sp.]|nr:hypothetical protein [Candidatus Eisenbacteria bacterium]
MRRLIVLFVLAGLTGVAFAEKPVFDEPDQPIDIQCDLTEVVYDWDFATGDHGFFTELCEVGGVTAWEYGATTYIAGAPGNVWGTVLNDDYPNETGDGLISPSFLVDESTVLMEIFHYFDIETNYDGCNIVVNGIVITPMTGYSVPEISTSPNYYAWCVDMEPGWTGHNAVWAYSCFDLSQFMDQEVRFSLEFGSDDSVNYPGWYIAYIKVGNAGGTATDGDTWGAIKSMFR